MAQSLGVQHILGQRAGLCSYGEQQRIAIIRALMQPFEWLLLDEPFSHLDKENIIKAAALIKEECLQRNAGFIITDLDEDEHFESAFILRHRTEEKNEDRPQTANQKKKKYVEKTELEKEKPIIAKENETFYF